MKRKTILVAIDYVVINGIYNNEVYYYLSGGWGDPGSLYVCIDCGELFFITFGNKGIKDDVLCPNCKSRLKETLKGYPETNRTRDGKLVHLEKPLHINADRNNCKYIDVWEIYEHD
jgi:DNA-directed RNA polymerase subunit RPC12/RpoP